MKSSTPSPNSYHTKPISKLTRQDLAQACGDFLAELSIQLVFCGLFALLCTTIGAMIWISVWCAVLFVPLIMVGYYLFKKYQHQSHQNT